jgi:hypothetical protein
VPDAATAAPSDPRGPLSAAAPPVGLLAPPAAPTTSLAAAPKPRPAADATAEDVVEGAPLPFAALAPLDPAIGRRRTARAWPIQLGALYHRANVDYWRNEEMVLVRVITNVFLGVLFGILFLQVDVATFAGTQSRLGFILGGVAFASIVFLSTGQTLQFERRGIY